MKHLKRFETFFIQPENEPMKKDYLDEIEEIETETEITNPPKENDEITNPESDEKEDMIVSYEEEESDKYESKKDKPVSYEESGLKRPELADRNKNKKIEGWEKAIAKRIEKSIEDRKKK